MSFILLGVLVLVLSSFVLLVGTNYAYTMWEEKKLDSIKSKNDTINEKIAKDKANAPVHALTGKKLTEQIKDHMLVKEDSEKFVEKMFEKASDFWFQFSTNSFKAIKGLAGYLLSLTKPLEESVAEQQVNAVKEEVEIDNSVGINEPVAALDNSSLATISKPMESEKPIDIQPTSVIKDESENQKQFEEATISIVKDIDESKKEELGLFEKMENRILKKLQKSGMSDYDIWLELGDLYVKYNEIKKAMEIYALVLKHSTDETQKEKAMNKLIGL